MEVVRFKKEHLAGFIPREAVPEPFPTIEKRLDLYAQCGLAYSLIHDGRTIAIAGVAFVAEGVGEAWALTDFQVKRYPLAFHRAVKSGLNTIFETYKLRRIQAVVLADWRVGREWLKRLGFQSEGIMEAFGPDSADYIRYAKVRV